MNKEIEIPEGHEARIEGNKVILERKESEDERIRKALVKTFEKVNGIKVPYSIKPRRPGDIATCYASIGSKSRKNCLQMRRCSEPCVSSTKRV